MASTKRTYIITGMGRSGTSFLAESLKKNGIDIGKEFYMGEDPYHGYEDKELVDITKTILVKAGQGCGIHAKPARRNRITVSYKILQNKIKEYLKSKKNKTWGVKEPRLSLILDKFINEIDDDDPFIYVAFRKPRYVARSLNKLNSQINRKEAEETAKEYNRRLLESLSKFLELND